MKPLLLDLFCGAGGAAMGYYRAGFQVVGVDHKPQKHYPFEFHQEDALRFLSTEGSFFDYVHASPPCQRYSFGTPNKGKHPDLLPITRKYLEKNGKPWVIENVPGAPMRADFKICGCMVGLPKIRRLRLFELWVPVFILMPTCGHDEPVITLTGHGTTTGNRLTHGRNISVREMREAMQIDWMNRDELSQAIPPAYTEFIGRKILEADKQINQLEKQKRGCW